jgi:hypothetical protein
VILDLPRNFEFRFLGCWDHPAAVWARIRNKWPGITFDETTGAPL